MDHAYLHTGGTLGRFSSSAGVAASEGLFQQWNRLAARTKDRALHPAVLGDLVPMTGRTAVVGRALSFSRSGIYFKPISCGL